MKVNQAYWYLHVWISLQDYVQSCNAVRMGSISTLLKDYNQSTELTDDDCNPLVALQAPRRRQSILERMLLCFVLLSCLSLFGWLSNYF